MQAGKVLTALSVGALGFIISTGTPAGGLLAGVAGAFMVGLLCQHSDRFTPPPVPDTPQSSLHIPYNEQVVMPATDPQPV